MIGVSTSCGACKFLRRKCTSECVFAPYFSYDEAAVHFSAVHKVFGASNVSRLLVHLPEHHRSEAALSISYEALARMHDPVYGCVAYIYALQQEVANLQEEIDVMGNHMANLNIGISSGDYSGTTSYQAEANNNTMINSPLHLSSEEESVDLPDYWAIMNYQQEQSLPENNEANYSNHTGMLLPQPMPMFELEEQNRSNFYANFQQGVVEGVLNQDILFCSGCTHNTSVI